jgi:cyclase
MLKKRLIPVLLLKEGMLVRSERFTEHQVIGTPLHEVKRFNEWNVDELIYLDITRSGTYDLRRDDHGVPALADPLAILDAVSETCFMPLTFGGRVTSVEHMRAILGRGADKIAVNSQAVRTPELITEGAHAFGSQAIVVSIDVREDHVWIDGGRTASELRPEAWAKEAEARGAGEILLQAIDRDGTAVGYDTELIARVANAVRIPVIACSGVGKYEDYAKGIAAGASAVAAANIWHFKEMADRGGKRALQKAGVDVRPPG